MPLHLVTGHAGTEHISSNDASALNGALYGTGGYVLEKGNMFAASIVSNNTIRLLGGEILFQGRHIRLDESEFEDLTITNGEQNMKRNDLIVARYSKDTGTGVETATLVVIKGTSSAETPADPSYNAGDINSGATIADMLLYRIPLDGLNVGVPEKLFMTKGRIPMIYSGATPPPADFGEIGDLYIQY